MLSLEDDDPLCGFSGEAATLNEVHRLSHNSSLFCHPAVEPAPCRGQDGRVTHQLS